MLSCGLRRRVSGDLSEVFGQDPRQEAAGWHSGGPLQGSKEERA